MNEYIEWLTENEEVLTRSIEGLNKIIDDLSDEAFKGNENVNNAISVLEIVRDCLIA